MRWIRWIQSSAGESSDGRQFEFVFLMSLLNAHFRLFSHRFLDGCLKDSLRRFQNLLVFNKAHEKNYFLILATHLIF